MAEHVAAHLNFIRFFRTPRTISLSHRLSGRENLAWSIPNYVEHKYKYYNHVIWTPRTRTFYRCANTDIHLDRYNCHPQGQVREGIYSRTNLDQYKCGPWDRRQPKNEDWNKWAHRMSRVLNESDWTDKQNHFRIQNHYNSS